MDTEEKTASFVDKSTWGDGPWQSEPDRLEFRVPELPTLACLMVRGPMGSWCGYVGVPPGHPAHGKDDGELDLKVHGGLTYAAPCMVESARGPEALVCHVPQPGESDDVWWLGFDCGHAWDVSPGMAAMLRGLRGTGGGRLSPLPRGHLPSPAVRPRRGRGPRAATRCHGAT